MNNTHYIIIALKTSQLSGQIYLALQKGSIALFFGQRLITVVYVFQIKQGNRSATLDRSALILSFKLIENRFLLSFILLP